MGKQYSVNVAGESFRQKAIGYCKVGEDVIFDHDAGNAYDPRAIKVMSTRGDQIGFLPKGGWLTAALLDEESDYDATIGDLLPPDGARPYWAVVLKVELL